MRPLPSILASILALAAATAAAQAPQAAQGTTAAPQAQQGFFRPQPGDDPSLFHTLPPEAYRPAEARQPAAQPAATPAPAESRNAPIVVVVPQPAASPQEQLDRAQLEAEQARVQAYRAPAPINGAFTGLTDERDR